MAEYATCFRVRVRHAKGFTLLETLLVVAIGLVLTALAMPVSAEFIKWARADSSAEFTLRAIAQARDIAVAQRRNIELTFIEPNRIRLERQDIDENGAVTGKTQLSEVILENGLQFLQYPGIPDTPDAFGADAAISFGGVAPVMFTSDGSFVDSQGDVVNGTVFVGTPRQPLTARAVTIFGVSGLTRVWKWRGDQWMK
jgi:prepilin-type N-terminal cleavage/methylation domain-containing protein